MKRSTQLAELKTQVIHNTLHKVTARGGKGSKMVANRTKQSLRITLVKTTHSGPFIFRQSHLSYQGRGCATTSQPIYSQGWQKVRQSRANAGQNVARTSQIGAYTTSAVATRF